MLKVLVWGIGGTWKHIKEYIDYNEIDIVGFIDKNPVSDVMRVNNKEVPVSLPEDYFVQECKVDKIFIASIYLTEIRQQLMEEFGISPEKIVTYQHPSRRMMKDSYFEKIENARRQGEIYRKVSVGLHLQAKLLNHLNINKEKIQSIKEVEYKVYSQWGEDGIIQYLIHKIPIENKTFIEFGVENYQEANTRFLLEENNWSGMIIDGSHENIEDVKREKLYWRYDLQAVEAFITKENINDLLLLSGFDHDLGLLSIDIDGNDYWVLQEINVMAPRILICEYNAIYGEHEAVTVPYKADFNRTIEHYSNLYFGASLEAVKQLAKEKGYCFIGTNSNACNAFFIREDLVKFLPGTIVTDHGFTPYKFRQARDKDGKLLFLSKEEEIALIADRELYDIREKRIKRVCDLIL